MLQDNSSQLSHTGNLRHFLSIEGLPESLLRHILDCTSSFIDNSAKPIKKVPLLRGKTVVNLFFEPSTRTRTTFELAEKRLSADIIHLDIARSSASKGESLHDTLRTMESMYSDMFVVRHPDSGAVHYIAKQVAPHIRVINAGDGCHAHPTQAIIDMFTIRKHKGAFENLTVAIVGDILHSRVARSDIHALNTFNTGEIRVIAPRTLMPQGIEDMGVRVFHDMDAGLKDADVIIMLRLQRERITDSDLLPSANEYFQRYGLDEARVKLAKPDVIVMHPGPINRGIEIESAVADGSNAVILEQVSYGIAARMAIMALIIGHPSKTETATP